MRLDIDAFFKIAARNLTGYSDVTLRSQLLIHLLYVLIRHRGGNAENIGYILGGVQLERDREDGIGIDGVIQGLFYLLFISGFCAPYVVWCFAWLFDSVSIFL